ncbi:MAG: hypothetical protein WHV60_09990 [Bacteroidota bacterium]
MKKLFGFILALLWFHLSTFANGFTSWEKIKVDDLDMYASTQFCLCNGKLVVALGNNIYISTDGGNNWITKRTPFSDDSTFIYDILCKNDTIFVSFNSYYPYGIYISTDFGETWEPKNKGILFNKNDPLSRFRYSDEEEIYLGSLWYFYKTTDGGENWIILNDRVPFTYNGHLAIRSMDKQGNKIVVAGPYNVGYSEDYGNTYIDISPPINTAKDEFNSIAFLGEYIFVSSQLNGILRTSDKGKTWEQKSIGISLDGIYINLIKSYKGILFAGTNYKGLPSPIAKIRLYISTDLGETWKMVEVDTVKGGVRKIEFSGDTIYVNRGGEFIYRAKISELLEAVPVVEEKVYHFYATEPVPTPANASVKIRLY